MFQNLSATFYKPLESGIQGACGMHSFYRKLWLTALWKWNSCLSEISQSCSSLLWRNGFAEAKIKHCEPDVVWTDREMMLLLAQKLLRIDLMQYWISNVAATLTNRDKSLFSMYIYWLHVQGYIHKTAATRSKRTSQGFLTKDKRSDGAIFL